MAELVSRGFPFYTTASSMLTAGLGLFGLTLPFGANVEFLFFSVVLASPLMFLVLAPFGEGDLFRERKKLVKMAAPLVLMQLSLMALADSAGAQPDHHGVTAL